MSPEPGEGRAVCNRRQQGLLHAGTAQPAPAPRLEEPPSPKPPVSESAGGCSPRDVSRSMSSRTPKLTGTWRFFMTWGFQRVLKD